MSEHRDDPFGTKPQKWIPSQGQVIGITLRGIVAFVVLIIFVGFALYDSGCVTGSDGVRRGRPRTSTTARSSSTTGRTEAEFAAERWVRSQLLAPSTATIHRARSRGVVGPRDDCFLFEVAVDAENAFGARLRATFYVAVQGDRVIAGGDSDTYSASEIRQLAGW